MTIGYKWTLGDNGLVCIITLHCHNSFADENSKIYNGKSFYTTDCSVIKIQDLSGNDIQRVKGRAFYEFEYYVGQRIQGTRIFFVKEIGIIEEDANIHQIGNDRLKRENKLLHGYNEAFKRYAKEAERCPIMVYCSDVFIERYFLESGFSCEDLIELKCLLEKMGI